MKRWLRRILIIAAVIAVFVLLVPVMIFTALQNDQVRSVAVDRVLSEVNADLLGTVDVERIEGSLLGHARVKGVRIVDGRGNLAAELEVADIRFGVLPLLTQSIAVNSVAIDGATVVVRNYDDDVLNWQTLAPPDPEPEITEPFEWPVTIDDIALADVAVAYFDETTELPPDIAGLASWKQELVDELNSVQNAPELRTAFDDALTPELIADFSGPRAPLALWFSELDAGADFRMHAHDIEVAVSEIGGQAQSDVFAQSLDTVIDDIDLAMGVSSMSATLASLRLGDWLRGQDIRYGMTMERIPVEGQELAVRAPEDDPFERLFVDLGDWTASEPLFDWAAPEVPIASPLFVGGRLSMTPETLSLIADIDREQAQRPIEVALRLQDYDQDIPRFDVALRAEEFSLLQWLHQPDLPAVETTAHVSAQGQGFEIDDLVADLRLRLTDTKIDDTYEADEIYAAANFEDGTLVANPIVALTPYLDLYSSLFVDLDGRATLKARTEADEAQAAQAARGSVAGASRAEMELDVDIRFEPDIENLPEAITTVEASSSWNFADFFVEDFLIGQSTGQVSFDAARDDDVGEQTYHADFSIDADGRNLAFEDFRLGSFDITDTGAATFSLAPDDPLEMIRSFENNLNLRASSLRSPDVDLDRAHISMNVDRIGPDARRADAELATNLQGLRTSELSADLIEADIDASVQLGANGLYVEGVGADLRAQAKGLTSDAFSAGNISADFEGVLGLGTGDNPLEYIEGQLLAEAASINAEDLSIDDVNADFDGHVVLGQGQMPAESVGGRLVASIKGLDSDEFSADQIDADFDGALRLGPGEFPLRSLEGRLLAQMADISADDLIIDSVDTEVDGNIQFTQGEMPLERVHASFLADVQGIASDDFSLAAIDANFDTDLRFGPGHDPMDLLQYISLRGESTGSDLEVFDPEISTDRIEFSTDLSGPVDDPRGGLRAEAHDITAMDEDISQVTASVVILEELRRAQINLDVWHNDSDHVHVGSSVDFDPGYEVVELTNIDIATDRTQWHTPAQSILRWTGERIEAHEFELASVDKTHRLFADGHFHPEVDQQLEAGIETDIGDLLYSFYLQPFFPDIDGHFDLRAAMAGTASQPELDLEVALDDFELVADIADIHLADLGLMSFGLSASYRDQWLRIEEFGATVLEEDLLEMSALIPIDLDLDLDDDPEVLTDRRSELHLEVFPQDLRRFHVPLAILNDFGIDGVFAAELDWSGRIEEPYVDFALSLTNFEFQGELGDDFVDLEDFDLMTQLHYESRAVGGDGLDFSADVTWEDEQAAEITASTPFPFEDWIIAILDEDQDEVDDIDWEQELLGLPFALTVLVPSLELGRIPIEELQEENLAGTADIDIELSGTVDNPTGHLDVDFSDVGWSHYRDFTFQLDAEIEDHNARFDQMSLTWGDDDIFSGQGIIPLPIPTLLAGDPISDLPIDFSWQLHETKISRLSAIDYEFARIQGSIGASVELGGSLRSPTITADAGVYDTRLGDGSDGSLLVEFAGVDDQVSLKGAMLRNQESLVAFDGRAPILLDLLDLAAGENWQLPGDLAFELESEPIDLADVIPTQLVSDFILDPAGILELAAQIGGTWEEPQVGGFIDLDDGAVTLPEFARRFVDINSRIDVDNEEIRIDHFEVHDGPSHVELAGTVSHELFVPDDVDLEVEADQFNLAGFGVDFPMFLTAQATINGHILGDPGELDIHVSGLDVVLTDEWDRALHSTDLDPDIVILNREDRGQFSELTDEDADEADGLNLIINIIVDRDAWARHPIGQLNFEADLSADITGNLVAITGSVNARRGDIEFLGRRFSVQESRVNFTGSIPPNPRLQIEAHHFLDRAITQALGPPTVGEPRVMFHITGTAEQPRLELQSDPAMTDTEILFVLMTGRPPDRSDIGRDEGVANQALAAVSGLFVGLLQDELAGNVPFDVLRVEPGVDGVRGVRLEVGTYLTNDLFLSYRRQFQADEDVAPNVFRLEYHFMPRWMVELLYTSHNEGELNLLWDLL